MTSGGQKGQANVDDSWDRAVRFAHEHAQPGDTVLLAPACASFDQFKSYEHRGQVFKDLVRQLEHKH